MPIADLTSVFGVIFLAELGDKTQLLALSFATRARWPVVLAGLALAAAVLTGAAAALGNLVGELAPPRVVAAGAGLLFLGFAWWTWRDDDATDDATDEPSGPRLLTIAAAFVVAELGDKSMLATATLATSFDPLATWVGGTLAMTAASGLAIVLGRLLGRRLPPDRLRRVSALAFVVVGVLLLVDAAVDTGLAAAP